MPPVVTLDDLTAMMAADENHRYEISPEGVASPPPPGYNHAIIATRLMVWLAKGGVPSEHIAQAVGLRHSRAVTGVSVGAYRTWSYGARLRQTACGCRSPTCSSWSRSFRPAPRAS